MSGVIGYRLFVMIGGGRLSSIAVNHEFSVEPEAAVCKKREGITFNGALITACSDISEPGPPPHLFREGEGGIPACGYYAVTDFAEVAPNVVGVPNFVIARVEGYGLVRIHEHGWRAQYMRIQALYAFSLLPPMTAGEEYYNNQVKRAALQYGCAVEEEDLWRLASMSAASSSRIPIPTNKIILPTRTAWPTPSYPPSPLPPMHHPPGMMHHLPPPRKRLSRRRMIAFVAGWLVLLFAYAFALSVGVQLWVAGPIYVPISWAWGGLSAHFSRVEVKPDG